MFARLIRQLFAVMSLSLLQLQIGAQVVKADSVILQWVSVSGAIVSNDGSHAAYFENNGIEPFSKYAKRLVCVNLNDRSTQCFPNIKDEVPPVFTDDSRFLLFISQSDCLRIVDLKTGSSRLKNGISSFVVLRSGDSSFIACKFFKSDSIAILNFGFNCMFSARGVEQLKVTKDENAVLLKINAKDSAISSLLVYYVKCNKAATIVSNAIIEEYNSDDSGRNIACLLKERNEIDLRLIQLDVKNVEVFKSQTIKSPAGFEYNNLGGYSKQGEYLEVSLKKATYADSVKSLYAKVDIWGFNDSRLISEQEFNPRTTYAALVCVNNRGSVNIIRIENEGEYVVATEYVDSKFFSLVQQRTGSSQMLYERTWNKLATPRFYLVTAAGRRLLPTGVAYRSFSENQKFIVAEDEKGCNLYTYEIKTGILRNVTRKIAIPFGDAGFDMPATMSRKGYQVWRWTDGDSNLIIKDAHDIWKISSVGAALPFCITNGVGRRNNWSFDFLPISMKLGTPEESFVSIVTDNRTHRVGYWKVSSNMATIQIQPKFKPLRYDLTSFSKGIVKAKSADVYVLLCESPSLAPNYFTTKDFLRFRAVSHVQPQRQFNWYKTEIYTFDVDKKRQQFILYKPNDFDNTRKYPVIFHYYQKISQDLYRFITPLTSGGDLDIPWFVSRGYVVCAPDISYTIGKPGASALSTIIRAAQSLKRFRWVDMKSLGLQGHSFGAFETNYVITHTNKFAAAVSSAGVNNIITDYLAIESPGTGRSHQVKYEAEQYRIGSTLWEHPELYIENSPIFLAHRINTPVLMVSNVGDGRVPFAQGIALFTALRRLGKRVWMLQYGGQGHGVSGMAEIDYLTRMTQFYDHYLKKMPAPKWMLNGVTFKEKDIDDGLDLVFIKDALTGNWITPKAKLLTDKQRKKIIALEQRTPINLTIK